MKNITRILFIFNKKDRWAISGLGMLMLVSAALETIGVALIFPLMSLITRPEIVVENVWLNKFYVVTHCSSHNQFIFLLSFLFFMVFVFKNTFMICMLYLQENFLATRRYQLHTKLYNAYLTSPYIFHVQNNSAVLMRNIDEIGTVFQSVIQPALKIITDMVIIFFLAAMLFMHNSVVTCVIVFFIGGAALSINFIFRRKLISLGAIRVDAKAQNYKLFFQGLGGIKDVQVLQREKLFIDRYSHEINRFLQANKVTSIIQQAPRLVMEVLTIGGMLLIVSILIGQSQDMSKIIPTLSLFALGTFRLLPSLTRIVTGINQLHYSQEIIDLLCYENERLEGFGYKKGANGENEDAQTDISFGKSIELSNLSFKYPSREEKVIKNLSLSIPKGKSIALAGLSGSGKTTLVDMILGLLPPLNGAISVDGINIRENLRAWRKHLGYVAQFIFIADESVRSNIAYGIPSELIDEEAVKKALQAAQLWDVVQDLTDGLDTILGENGVRLSGGQRQRIGIARALYHNPDVLILDEATSSLDGETEYEVTRAIEQLSKSKTLIVIAHRLSTVKKCDTIYFLHEGEIVDQGSFEELMGRNEQFSKMANLVSF